LLAKDMEGCCTVLVSDPEHTRTTWRGKGKATWNSSSQLCTVFISATMGVKLTLKPTQARTPAMKKRMLSFTKTGFSYALRT
jgi:hypothetical protein